MSSIGFFRQISFPCKTCDAPPRKNLDAFRDDVERRIASKHTHRQIRSWLAGEGLTVSKGTLQSRCVAWEATRRTRTAGTAPTLIEAVEAAFHTTDYNDQTIADNITATGFSTVMVGGDVPCNAYTLSSRSEGRLRRKGAAGGRPACQGILRLGRTLGCFRL
jgi:hypothetical protein